MYICVCKAVNERRIHEAVEDGAVHLRDLRARYGLGTCCGRCVPEARALMQTALAEQGQRRGENSLAA